MSKHISTNMSHKEPMSKSASGPEQNRTKLPFKLIPVQPPQKKSDVNITTTSVVSTTTTKLPEKKMPKVKLKSIKRVVIQRRALSPVSEDMEPSEVREQQKNNVFVVETVDNKILSFEESMEFETIDERDLPMLTEESTTTFSQEGRNQFAAKTVPNIDSQDVNSPVGSTSPSNEQTTFAKDTEVLVEQKTSAKNRIPVNQSVNMEPKAEFSTPDRPAGPLLEEQFVTSESATNTDIHQAIESVRAQFITSKGMTRLIQIP